VGNDGVGGAVQLKLSVSVGGLRGSSVETEGTSMGVGIWQSFWGGGLVSGERVATWRWQRAVPRV
jgi:hypothetical protein